jgi:hypothetical protein
MNEIINILFIQSSHSYFSLKEKLNAIYSHLKSILQQLSSQNIIEFDFK